MNTWDRGVSLDMRWLPPARNPITMLRCFSPAAAERLQFAIINLQRRVLSPHSPSEIWTLEAELEGTVTPALAAPKPRYIFSIVCIAFRVGDEHRALQVVPGDEFRRRFCGRAGLGNAGPFRTRCRA